MTRAPFWAILAAILVASMGLKFASFGAEPGMDSPRFTRDLTQLLNRKGFVAVTGNGKAWQREIMTVRDKSCMFRFQNATILGADFEAAQRNNLNSGHPIRYVRAGEYLDSYPGLAIEIRWRMQREAARVGWQYPIEPVIAVGASDICWPDPTIFSGALVHMR